MGFGRKNVYSGTLNVKMKVGATSLAVHIEEALNLTQQDRNTKELADCLKFAAMSGWCDVIGACVHLRGADVNAQLDGARCRSPLMYASATQQVDTLSLPLFFSFSRL